MPWTTDAPPDVAKNWTPDEISKCVTAANSALDADPADESGAIYACIAAAGKGQQAARHFAKTYTLDVEVFAVGKWNGMKFTGRDLQDVAGAFTALKDVLRVPLKFGHNDDQPLTDGQPALGWVEDVYVKQVDGIDKLFARFVDMPKIVYDAMKARLYRNVSIELDFDVSHMGKHYPLVLTGVALLGADIPAVNVLADLQAYMHTGTRLECQRSAVFSSTSGQSKPAKEETTTMVDVSQEELDRLRKAERDNAQFKADKEKADADAKAAQDALRAKEDAERKEKIRLHREKITGMIEAAVTDMRITPAQRTTFAKLLRIEDDEAVMSVTEATVEELVGKPTDKAKKKFGRETGEGHMGQEHDDDDGLHGDDSGDKLTFAANKIRADNPKLTFSQALEHAMLAHPDLAKDHIQASFNLDEED